MKGYKGVSSINIKDLHWKYGDHLILDDINIEIEKGKFYSIVGPNGSGKTTLLKNILKHLEPKKNTLYIEDIDVTTLSSNDMGKRIASVPQNTRIDFEFTTLDIVMMGRTPHLKRFEIEGEMDLKICREAMEKTDIWRFKDKLIQELSGGEKQRVIVARAIAQQADILLLDEPISHLDIHHQVELLETVSDLNEKKEITVVAVLHDLNLAAQYSDYIFLLSQGKVLSYGEPEDVIREEIITKAFKTNVCIIKNPITGKPHVIPIRNPRKGENHESL